MADTSNKTIDSLLFNLKTAKDTSKVNTLNILSRQYLAISNFDSSLEYANQAKKNAEQINYAKGLANAILNIGSVEWNTSNFEDAMTHFNESLKIYSKIKNKKGIANSYNNMGLVYWSTGDYDKAVENILKSMEIWDELKDKRGIAMGELNIGNIYLNQDKNDKALEHYFKALKIGEDIQEKEILGLGYNNVGVAYGNKKNNDKAFEFHEKALKIELETGDQKSIGMSYNNMGIICMDLGNYEHALLNFEQASAIAYKIGDLKGLAVAYNNVARALYKKGQYDESIEYNTKALYLSKRTGYKQGLQDVYFTFSDIYESQNNFSKALEYYKLYTNIKDSLLNESSSQQIADMTTKYGSEKKDKEIKLLNQQRKAELELSVAESRKQQIIIIAVLVVLLLALIFAYFMYRNSQHKQKLNQQLEKLSIVASETDNAVLICDAKGVIEWANVGLEKLLGYTLDELKVKGTTIEQLSSNPNIKEVINESVLNKKSCTYQVLNKTKDGSYKWTQSTLTPIFGKNNQLKKLVIIDTDISERKKIEDLLSKQNEILETKVEERTAELVKQNAETEELYNNIQVLNEIGKEITSTFNLEHVLDTVYAKVNALMDATEFGFGIYNAEKNAIDFSNYYYESRRMDADLDTWVSMDDDNRFSVWCVKNRKPVFINDMQKEYSSYIKNLDSYKGEGKLLLESVICLPLTIEDKMVGVISVQSPKKNAYTKKHLEILQTLASSIAISLDNARLYSKMEFEIKERTKEIEKQKITLEDKNLKITDSINYALRIQQAILPSQQMLSTILPNSFVLFQPKDIVSGDFYWAHAINQHEILFAAVDCTGHGVPGAFMSIMGYNLLEQIVKEQKIHKPASILDELSKAVVRSLKQTAQLGSIKEGMDIALCKINYKTLELEYAGAHNPLTIVRNNELLETKADSKAIGISLANTNSFTNHKTQLKQGDCIYIFSDGYADQKGGANNQKFFYHSFKQLLINSSSKPIKEQEKLLENTINDWKGNNEQIDDILVIGVRV